MPDDIFDEIENEMSSMNSNKLGEVVFWCAVTILGLALLLAHSAGLI